jgi:hypothetical protein
MQKVQTKLNKTGYEGSRHWFVRLELLLWVASLVWSFKRTTRKLIFWEKATLFKVVVVENLKRLLQNGKDFFRGRMTRRISQNIFILLFSVRWSWRKKIIGLGEQRKETRVRTQRRSSGRRAGIGRSGGGAHTVVCHAGMFLYCSAFRKSQSKKVRCVVYGVGMYYCFGL